MVHIEGLYEKGDEVKYWGAMPGTTSSQNRAFHEVDNVGNGFRPKQRFPRDKSTNASPFCEQKNGQGNASMPLHEKGAGDDTPISGATKCTQSFCSRTVG